MKKRIKRAKLARSYRKRGKKRRCARERSSTNEERRTAAMHHGLRNPQCTRRTTSHRRWWLPFGGASHRLGDAGHIGRPREPAASGDARSALREAVHATQRALGALVLAPPLLRLDRARPVLDRGARGGLHRRVHLRRIS